MYILLNSVLQPMRNPFVQTPSGSKGTHTIFCPNTGSRLESPDISNKRSFRLMEYFLREPGTFANTSLRKASPANIVSDPHMMQQRSYSE